MPYPRTVWFGATVSVTPVAPRMLPLVRKRIPDVPFITASGLAGYGGEDSIQVNKIGKTIYVVGDLETGARPGCGLMAPRVGIAASMQANLALRLIVDGNA